MIPPARGRLNAIKSVFLTSPFLVAMSTWYPGSNSGTAKHGSQTFAGFEIQQIDNRLAETHATGLGDIINLAPVDLAFIGKEHESVMGGSHKQMLDKIILF